MVSPEPAVVAEKPSHKTYNGPTFFAILRARRILRQGNRFQFENVYSAVPQMDISEIVECTPRTQVFTNTDAHEHHAQDIDKV